ncbi:ATPeFH, ATP14 [Ceraceosorus bombacis]|uniref:ATPeFH, ATP14 n=1 Tax=Ceraceosorus bombacis TaxID=401625 RepID=A0A0P1BC49_9BASI|nr:ATPeFH, ATP14 [Ceraceosorus bombacis]
MLSALSNAALSATRSRAPMAARSLSSSAIASKDFVQEIYIKELKAYKAPAKSADAHKGQVRDFHAPKAPQAPSVSTSDISSELDAYSKSEPDVAEASASSSSSGSLLESHEDVNAWLEEAKKPVVKEHH